MIIGLGCLMNAFYLFLSYCSLGSSWWAGTGTLLTAQTELLAMISGHGMQWDAMGSQKDAVGGCNGKVSAKEGALERDQKRQLLHCFPGGDWGPGRVRTSQGHVDGSQRAEGRGGTVTWSFWPRRQACPSRLQDSSGENSSGQCESLSLTPPAWSSARCQGTLTCCMPGLGCLSVMCFWQLPLLSYTMLLSNQLFSQALSPFSFFYLLLYFNAFVLLKAHFQAWPSDNHLQRLHESLSSFMRRKDLFGHIVYPYIVLWLILIFLLKFLQYFFKPVSVLGFLRELCMLINCLQNCHWSFLLCQSRVAICL